MPENTQHAPSDTMKPDNDKKSTTLHTCACGEQHEVIPGSPSHRDACTSTLKFGDSCCCGSGNTLKEEHRRCGHGYRCR